MKNEIRSSKKYRCRIYHQDRYTNKIWYLEMVWPTISYNYLELYLKENNKKFLYITKIDGCKEKASRMMTEHKVKCQ